MYTPSSAGLAFDVAVVGRGAVGAAAALGLARLGLRVANVAPTFPAAGAPGAPGATAPAAAGAPTPADWDPRVYALSPATRTLLQSLMVWDALDASRVAPVYDMRIFPAARADAPELHFSAFEACVDALSWIVEDRNLTGALERAMAFSGITHIDARVEAVDTRRDPADPRPAAGAQLRLSDGRVLRAKLVVAADGADSPLRAKLAIPTSTRAYPQHAVVANFTCARPHRDCAWQWFGAHGILALLPLPDHRVSMVWSAPEPLADTLMALDADELAQRVAETAQGVLGALAPLTPARRFPLRLIEVDRLCQQRVVLVGDAAHVVHPLAGQGMNLGFGDVKALLDVLAAREPFRDLGETLLLRRYERARREAVAAMRVTTDGLQRLFDPESEPALPGVLRPLVGLRETGWRLVASSPWLKRRLIAHAAS